MSDIFPSELKFDSLPYALGKPLASARLRTFPEDFQVDEHLGYPLTGEGEHAWLHLRKRNTNTAWAAGLIADLAKVARRDVGYAGLKDRNAVTSQWFSIGLAGRPEPDWEQLNSDELTVLEATRHQKKLRRGGLAGNHFQLILREFNGDKALLEQRLQRLKEIGAPNWFGSQRFGHDYGNLAAATALFRGRRERDRQKRGLYLSAARSLLFNAVLARRLLDGNWNQALAGEMMALEGSQSVFAVETPDAELSARLAALDVHPTGPLWGRGRPPVSAVALAMESETLESFAEFREGLEMAGLKQARRALRICLRDLEWCFPEDDVLQLAFSLPAGSYATAVVREILDSEIAPRNE